MLRSLRSCGFKILMNTQRKSGTRLGLTTYSPLHRESSDLSNAPVKFSGSGADKDAFETFRVPESDAPRYQGKVVIISLCAFMIYFCILREENDIDDYLSAYLLNVMDPQAEAKRLEERLAKEEKEGMDTSDTRSQLAAVEERLNIDLGTRFKQTLEKEVAKKKAKTDSASS